MLKIRISILLILTFCLLAVMPTFSKTERNQSYWGAIAYSFSTGTSGSAWDYSTEADASYNARRSCGQSDCKTLLTFANECGAVAMGANGAWGGGYGDSENEASSSALRTCRKYGGTSCRVIRWTCTSWDD